MNTVKEDEIDWTKKREPAMRDLIIATYFQWAVAIAKRKLKNFPSCVDPMELESAALYALMQSVDRYEYSYETTFKTFATHRIRGSIVDAMRDSDHLSRGVRIAAGKRIAAEMTLGHQLGRKPTREEILAETGLSIEMYSASLMKVPSLSKIVCDEGYDPNYGPEFNVSKKLTTSIDSPFDQAESFRHFARGIDMDGQTILYLYYYRQATMKTIGLALGMSESRVSQIHTNLIKEFRERGKERLLA